MLAKPVIRALIFSPSFNVFHFYYFLFFNNKFKLNKSDSLVACLFVFGMVSNLDCTGQKGEVWGEKEELGDEGGSWRVLLFPLSMETKAGVFL